MKTKSFFFLLFSTIMLTCSAMEPIFNLRTIPLARVCVTAHRGAGDLAPENALSSLELTWSMGGVPETDIRTTRDGVLVMFHDGNFHRVAPAISEEIRDKSISELTWDEIKDIDIGSFRGEEFKGQRVVTLAEIVEALKCDASRMIFIDVKNVDIPQLARETKDVRRQIIFTSGNYQQILEWKKIAPESEGFYWMGLGSGDEILAPKIEQLKGTDFEGIDRIQIHVNFDAEGNTTPTEEFILRTTKYIHENYPYIEVQLMPWNIHNSKACFKKLMDLGAFGFGSDRPDLCFEALSEYYQEWADSNWNVRDAFTENQIPIFFKSSTSENHSDCPDLEQIYDEEYTLIPEFRLKEEKETIVAVWNGIEIPFQQIVNWIKQNRNCRLSIDPDRTVDLKQLCTETIDIHPQLIFVSTSYEQLQAWKLLSPRSYILCSLIGSDDDMIKKIRELEENHFSAIDILRVDTGFGPNGSAEKIPNIENLGSTLRSQGILLQADLSEYRSSVSQAQFETLLNSGVASIVTDDLTLIKQYVSNYYDK